MFAWLITRTREVRELIAAGEANRAIAAGVALGILLGALPKQNLLAVLLGMLILSTRSSWGAACFTAVVASTLARQFDPWFDFLGRWLLTNSWLVPFWAGIYELPLLPWTRFNNTVVLGSLVSGLVLLAPVYASVLYVLDRWLPRAAGRELQEACHSRPLASATGEDGSLRLDNEQSESVPNQSTLQAEKQVA